jgi:hypothetical protein
MCAALSPGRKNVIVIAGGWSVSQYPMEDFRDRATVIGVNESMLLQHCHVGVTMDRLWMENRYPDLKERFYRASILRMEPEPASVWTRKGTQANIPQSERTHRVREFECDHKSSEMSMLLGRLNGTNSGMCAVNLALQMKPDRIYLLGFDMQKGPGGEPYYHAPYAWAVPNGATKKAKYDVWAPQFRRIAHDAIEQHVEIVNVNHHSKIETFTRYPYERFLKAINL